MDVQAMSTGKNFQKENYQCKTLLTNSICPLVQFLPV